MVKVVQPQPARGAGSATGNLANAAFQFIELARQARERKEAKIKAQVAERQKVIEQLNDADPDNAPNIIAALQALSPELKLAQFGEGFDPWLSEITEAEMAELPIESVEPGVEPATARTPTGRRTFRAKTPEELADERKAELEVAAAEETLADMRAQRLFVGEERRRARLETIRASTKGPNAILVTDSVSGQPRPLKPKEAVVLFDNSDSPEAMAIVERMPEENRFLREAVVLSQASGGEISIPEAVVGLYTLYKTEEKMKLLEPEEQRLRLEVLRSDLALRNKQIKKLTAELTPGLDLPERKFVREQVQKIDDAEGALRIMYAGMRGLGGQFAKEPGVIKGGLGRMFGVGVGVSRGRATVTVAGENEIDFSLPLDVLAAIANPTDPANAAVLGRYPRLMVSSLEDLSSIESAERAASVLEQIIADEMNWQSFRIESIHREKLKEDDPGVDSRLEFIQRIVDTRSEIADAIRTVIETRTWAIGEPSLDAGGHFLFAPPNLDLNKIAEEERERAAAAEGVDPADESGNVLMNRVQGTAEDFSTQTIGTLEMQRGRLAEELESLPLPDDEIPPVSGPE